MGGGGRRPGVGGRIQLAEAATHYAALAVRLAGDHPHADLQKIEAASRRAVERAAFLAMCQARGLDPPEELAGASDAGLHIEADLLRSCAERFAEIARTEGGLSGELLGPIHERLLGLPLVRDRRGNVKFRRSAAARKAAGVFYTPPCVTRYIVDRTIRPLLAQRDAEPILLDPACGCGAFLLAAVQRLRASVPVARLARWLHGVDLDRDAVLVCRRALWLELTGDWPASGEEARSLAATLEANVRCDDALGGSHLDCMAGCVDLVLGNPPYGRELDNKRRMREVAATQLGRRWQTARMDFWYYFVHRGLELLRPGGRLSFIVAAYWTAGRGAERLIAHLRDAVQVEEILLLDDLPVFPGVAGRHMILRVRKRGTGNEGRGTGDCAIVRRSPRPLAGEGLGVRAPESGDAASNGMQAALTLPLARRPSPASGRGETLESLLAGTVPLDSYEKSHDELFRDGRIDLEPPAPQWLAALDAYPALGTLGRVRQGIAENPATVTARLNARHGNRWSVGEGVFALTRDELAGLGLPPEELAIVRPYHDLCDLGRYRLADEPSRALLYTTAATCPAIERFPAIRAHLERFRPALEARRETRHGTRAWWQLHWPRDEAIWQAPKLVALQMARRPAFVPATRPVYVSFSVNVFVPDANVGEHLDYFAAVLNSRLLWRWFERHAKRRGVGLEINGGVLARAPIRRIDFAEPADRRRHDRLVELVGQMLSPKRDRDTVDREIETIVAELYGVEDGE